MIPATVTSSARPTALITSSRVTRVIFSSLKLLEPAADGSGERGCNASAARGKPRRVLGHDPELDCRDDGYGGADDHMDRHRGGFLETQYPGRDQRPKTS